MAVVGYTSTNGPVNSEINLPVYENNKGRLLLPNGMVSW